MTELPKALTEEERAWLGTSHKAERALAWIDAATSLLAEQAAQIVADEQALEAAVSGNAIATARARDAETQLVAANARLAEAAQCAQTLALAVDGYKVKLAAANALLEDVVEGHEEDPDGNIGTELCERIKAHLRLS